MASSVVLRVACLVLTFIVMGAPMAQAAISCGEVQNSLAPCFGYLKGSGGGAVPEPCCNGIRGLNKAAQTTADRQAVCKCMLSASTTISGINWGLASSLPKNCGLSVPYKFGPSTDCNSVK